MTKLWFKAAGVRALKTVAQTFGSMIAVGAAVNDVDWLRIASVALVAGFLSMITSVAGLPELKCEE